MEQINKIIHEESFFFASYRPGPIISEDFRLGHINSVPCQGKPQLIHHLILVS